MPNNRCITEQRLHSVKRKFDKDNHYKMEYSAFLNNMIDQGYAEIVAEDELKPSEGKAWYIPHHGVYYPRKGKLRVVFHCGATYKGTSLNLQLFYQLTHWSPYSI